MGKYLAAFKAYDVRGKVPSELNPDLAYKIGRAYADEIKPKTVCVGYDIRLSGPSLAEALTKGLNDAGVDVIDLG
ncbi:phosphomannomutase CpsG, partial [Listeria monocytogenes]